MNEGYFLIIVEHSRTIFCSTLIYFFTAGTYRQDNLYVAYFMKSNVYNWGILKNIEANWENYGQTNSQSSVLRPPRGNSEPSKNGVRRN